MSNHQLHTSLMTAISIEILHLRTTGVSLAQKEAAQRRLRAMRENSGQTEELLYGGPGTREAFQIIVECVAILAFEPGGVYFCGEWVEG